MTSRSRIRRRLASFTASIGISVSMVVLSPVVLAHAADPASAAAANQVTLQAKGAPAGNITAGIGGNPFGCVGKSDYPHVSDHFPDRAAAEARTSCVAWQPYEYVESYLYRKDCFFFVCWWTQVGHDSSSTQKWGVVYAHPNHTCNGTSTHTYRIESYHEVHGTDGHTYTANTYRERDVACG